MNSKDFRDLWRNGPPLPGKQLVARPVEAEKGLTGPGLLGTPLADADFARPAPATQGGSRTMKVPLCDDDAGHGALIDPLTMVLAPPPSAAPAVASDLTPRTDLAAAVEELVRRISWGGDRRAGTARIELGRGALEGASIVVQALGRRVQVELALPAGFDGRALEQRLRQRLASRGIEVAAVTLRQG